MPSRIQYDPQSTLREARAAYFEANNFGADGGYKKRWEIIKLGPVPIPIRNIEARVRAIRFHDLHHVLAGYPTDLRGEAEIAAFEIASGCADKWFAWLINLQGMILGLFVGPRAMWAAWVRGRHCRCLYPEEFEDSILERKVGDEQRRLGLDRDPPPPTLSDRLSFALWMAVTLGGHLAFLAAAAALVWWWLLGQLASLALAGGRFVFVATPAMGMMHRIVL